jgi:hypothetical protein
MGLPGRAPVRDALGSDRRAACPRASLVLDGSGAGVDARSVEEASRQLEQRRWEELANAALAVAASALAALGVLFGSRLVLALAIGAACAFALALVAAVRRYLLIERLALDRDAYVIAAVYRYGCRLTSRRTRQRLSRSLRSLVAEPWRRWSCIVPGRVAAFATDLEQLARELEDADCEVEPVSAAGCMRLLTDGAESPLLNPTVSTEDLRAALLRIRDGIRRAA